MGKTYYDRYMPIEVHQIKVNEAQATANKVVFTLPYLVSGVIAQIYKDADDTLYSTGQKVVIAQDATTKVVTVEVSATALVEDDLVNILAFK